MASSGKALVLRAVAAAAFILAGSTAVRAQHLNITGPNISGTQGLHALALPPNSDFTFDLPGQSSVAGTTDSHGGFHSGSHPPDSPAILPRTITLSFSSDVFTGTETGGPYPHLVNLSPFGLVSIEAPTYDFNVVIFGEGFLPECSSFTLYAEMPDGRVLNVAADSFLALNGGSTNGNTRINPDAMDATALVARGDASCSWMMLRGTTGGSLLGDISFSPWAGPFGPFVIVDRLNSSGIMSGQGLPPDGYAYFLVNGQYFSETQLPPDGSFGFNFEIPGGLPRTLTLLVDGQPFTGTETDTPYAATYGCGVCHVVPLTPFGTLLIAQPSTAAEVSAVSFPPTNLGCTYSLLAIQHDLSDRIQTSGVSGQDTDWRFNFFFPSYVASASKTIWRGSGACSGSNLTGDVPSGPFPWYIPLTPASPAYAPNMSVMAPVPLFAQTLSLAGVQPNSFFGIALGNAGAAPIVTIRTDASGAVANVFDITFTKPLFPRVDTVRLFGPPASGPLTGTEAASAYPRTVSLSPSGTLTLGTPVTSTRTAIRAEGLTAGCTYQIFAVSGATRTLVATAVASALQAAAVVLGLPATTSFEWAPVGGCGGSRFVGVAPAAYPAGFALTAIPLDSTPPVLALPADIVAEASGPTGSIVTYVATAADPDDPSVQLACAPSSGSRFPLGKTIVSCTASDPAGNSASGSFSIVVRDTLPPVITSATSTPEELRKREGQLVVVALSVVAVDAVDPSPACAIAGVSVSGPSAPGTLWTIGPGLSVTLAADRALLYSIQVRCADASGNASSTAISVPVVPKVGADVKNFFVNGNRLTANEEASVRFIAANVLPVLPGTADARIEIAARSTWWALKEGVLGKANPFVFSNCAEPVGTAGKIKDVLLDPLETCPGSAWQVGLAAIQVPNFSDAQVRAAAGALRPGVSTIDLLKEAAVDAGFDPLAGTGAGIAASTGILQRSWLLRHPQVGIFLVEQNVTPECVIGSQSWCFGTGWSQTKRYAPTKDGALRSIDDLRGIFWFLSIP